MDQKLVMATGLEYDDRVKYACSCSTFSPLVYQYFCKYCVKIRCPDCVTTSVNRGGYYLELNTDQLNFNRSIRFIVHTALTQCHHLKQKQEREGEVFERY